MWNYEADVVIVGYGGAGATAALAAVKTGAKVLVLEKNQEGGGNTKYSGGSLRTYLSLDKAIDHIETLCEGTTEREVVDVFVRESSRNSEWITEIGGEIFSNPPSKSETIPINLPLTSFPSIRGAEGMGPRVRVKGAGVAQGINLWGLLSSKVADSDVQLLFSSPAKRLLRDKSEGVIGVVATNGEKDFKIRARRGVILTCGGFEHDPLMQLNYLGESYYSLGNPGNNGDGIRLAMDIGADLWHMNAAAVTLGYKFPDFASGIKHIMPSAGFIYVDQTGKRFMDEGGTDVHIMWAPTSYIDVKTLERTRVPCYVIFDEDTRTKGVVGTTGHGRVSDVYQWSPDNGAEIAKGWIKAADTISDLAHQIKVRPDVLQASVSQYNLQCVGGYDPEFGRPPRTLVPIGRSPYYAMEMRPCLLNTQGGPKRNSRAQVLDVWGSPIKRLYSAGELGSLWHRNYPGAGNVTEALAFGRIAGKNAAEEQSTK